MLPSSLAPSLQMAANTAITKVFSKHTGKPNGEVSVVSTMTRNGFTEISNAWSPILKTCGLRIDLKAVFCHSNPKVIFKPVRDYPNLYKAPVPRCCELADLLIVIDHVDPSRNINDRRAVLIQAKMVISKDVPVAPVVPTLRKTAWRQHELLGWLPSFTFERTPPYDSRPRDLKGALCVGSHLHTAEYGAIHRNYPHIWHHWLINKKAPWLIEGVNLAQYLAGMATGDCNFSREAIIDVTTNTVDDWSFTVDELLQVTANTHMTKKWPVLRGTNNSVGYYIAADTTSRPYAERGGGDGDVEGEIPEWPDGPISTVHLTFSPNAREDRDD